MPRVLPRCLPLAVLVVACGDAAPQPAPAPTPTGPTLPTQAVVDELEQARRDTARLDAHRLRDAVQLHVLRSGECPAGIEALIEAHELDRARPDPWGRPLTMTCTDAGRTIAVTSVGADGRAGTDDDVTVDADR